MFQSQTTATALVSLGLWDRLVSLLGGSVAAPPFDTGIPLSADVPFLSVLLPVVCFALLTWLAGASWLTRRMHRPWGECLAEWGRKGWTWWFLPGLWEVLRILAFTFGFTSLSVFLSATPAMWLAVSIAGWFATWLAIPGTSPAVCEEGDLRNARPWNVPLTLWLGMTVYVVIYVTMNWQLYRGLLVPHGDSAMYEEHLWNLTHGKGFRSYLDQGVFLGEHIQVVHVLLLPLYALWPSHLLLELCESVALAAGAIPVYWIARRHTDSRTAALGLSCAYLLYSPLQYLDIAIDIKTFRPISFGVPFLLFALDALERRKYGRMLLWLVLTLSAKEDYALVLAPLGLWMAVAGEKDDAGRRTRTLGWGLAACAVVYLLLVVTVVLPWFRGGADPHYARYFGELGSTPSDIVRNVLTNPLPVLAKFFSGRSVVYALSLLLPLGLLPLLSLSRLAIVLPFFAMLCLLEISPDANGQGQMLVPFHHFHAPVIPFIFWAAAAGLGRVRHFRIPAWIGRCRVCAAASPSNLSGFANHFCWCSALTIGFFFSLSPLGLTFWDQGSQWYWRNLYIPGKRAELFPRVFERIPLDARVASTDFVHPRFTHHERSYDYSHYRRRVSGYELKVPDDTDYIVIDTQHRYSDIKRPEDVREYREHPDQWKLLPDTTGGYFIVLKRVRDRSPSLPSRPKKDRVSPLPE